MQASSSRAFATDTLNLTKEQVRTSSLRRSSEALELNLGSSGLYLSLDRLDVGLACCRILTG